MIRRRGPPPKILVFYYKFHILTNLGQMVKIRGETNLKPFVRSCARPKIRDE